MLQQRSSTMTTRMAASNSDEDEEAARLRRKAEELREQVRDLEKKLDRPERPMEDIISTIPEPQPEPDRGMNLDGKTVLVIGANGRTGSMVCRHLLRNFPKIGEVVAAVHTVSENSRTNRGYGRLSYEVGAEDGVGTIGAAWASQEDRTATFEYDPSTMSNYQLNKLRLVEVELLDPVQCTTITENVDCVIFTATDFNGNVPRAVSGLNMAFLFRAIASPDKGRVEIEGLRNVLEGLTANRKSASWNMRRFTPGSRIREEDTEENLQRKEPRPEHMNVVYLSPAEQAFTDFETPFGTFKDIKRQGENIVLNEFPSLTSCVLQMGRYEDNLVEESLEVVTDFSVDGTDSRRVGDSNDRFDAMTNDEQETFKADMTERSRRRINRRDAARAAAEALTNEALVGKKVEMYTALRKR